MIRSQMRMEIRNVESGARGTGYAEPGTRGTWNRARLRAKRFGEVRRSLGEGGNRELGTSGLLRLR